MFKLRAKFFGKKKSSDSKESSSSDHQLTDEQIATYWEVFKSFDKNGSGHISGKELRSVMRSLGLNPTDGEIEVMINEANADFNGKIEFPDFVAMMVSRHSWADSEDDLRKAFRTFDREGKGYISAANLRAVMEHLGQALREGELDEMMAVADANGDGRVSFEEFCKLMRSN